MSKFLKLFFAVFVIGLTSCGDSTDVNVKDAVLTIPDLISNGSSSSRAPLTDTELKNKLNTIYQPVTDVFNSFANEALKGTNAILNTAQTEIFDKDLILTAIQAAGTYELTKGEILWDIAYASSTYTFTATDTQGTEATDDDVTYLSFSVTPGENSSKGTIYFKDYDADATTPPVVKIIFDTADVTYGHITELIIINMEKYADSSNAEEVANAPSKLWLKFGYKDNEYSGAATVLYSSYDGAVAGDDFQDYFVDYLAQADSSSTASGCYSYRTIVSEDTSTSPATYKAALDLALVPSSGVSSTPFTAYSVSEAYKDIIARYIKNGDDGAGTNNIDAFNTMITDYNSAIGGAYSGKGYVEIGSTISAGTTTDAIFTIINTLNDFVVTDDISDYEFLNSFSFITKLTNPGYYDSTSIFLGTDDLDTPSWSSNFVTSTIAFDVKTPTEMGELTVTFPSVE